MEKFASQRPYGQSPQEKKQEALTIEMTSKRIKKNSQSDFV